MKKTFRLTALILALLMLVNISASATTTGITLNELDIATYTRMFQSASQAAQESEDAETVDVDGEEPAYHWGYVSGNASFNDVPGLGNALGTVPANSLIKVFYEESGSYKIEYNGVIGYISGSYLSQCKCGNASVTDPATHIDGCIYPKYFKQLANENPAEELYALWSGLTAEEQAFVLETLKDTDEKKYAELDTLLNPPAEEPEKEATTDDGTKVTVKGSNIPEDVTLDLDTVTDAAVLTSLLPGVDLQTAQYFVLYVKLMQGDNGEWQPANGEKITVTISANNVGTEGQYVALYHNHDGVTDSLGLHQITNGNLTFKIDGFSYVFGINVHSSACYYDKLNEMETAAERYKALMAIKTASYTEYQRILWEYKAEHLDSGLLCNCNLSDFSPEVYAPGSADHAETCPWHTDNLPTAPSVSEELEDGTTVTVSGNLPEDVTLALAPVNATTAVGYMPLLAKLNADYMALDITPERADGTAWQPASSETVTVSISANGFAENGDGIALYNYHDGQLQHLGLYKVADGKITFTTSGFSCHIVIRGGKNLDCWLDELQDLTTATARYEFLKAEREAAVTNYDLFMEHYIAKHSDANLVCTCPYDNAIGYVSDFYAPGDAAHKSDCPWAFKNLTAQEQAAVLEDKTAEELADYLATLTADQKVALLKHHMPGEDIDGWIAQYNPTEEMIARAMRATKLSKVILESDDLWADSELYYVRTGDLIAYYKYNAAQKRGEIIEPSCQLVVGYVNVETGVVTPVAEATAAN